MDQYSISIYCRTQLDRIAHLYPLMAERFRFLSEAETYLKFMNRATTPIPETAEVYPV